MGLLDGGLARIMTPVFASFYLDGTLHAGTGEPIYNPDTGEIIGYEGGDTPCKCQIDSATDAMRQSDGFAEGDCRLIILAQGIPEVTSDREVTVSGVRYKLQSADRDPALSHWVCRGRRNQADAQIPANTLTYGGEPMTYADAPLTYGV